MTVSPPNSAPRSVPGAARHADPGFVPDAAPNGACHSGAPTAGPPRRRLAAALALVAACTGTLAAAQTPLNGAEFEAYVEGRTLWFFSGGRAYGAERYKPGRKVVWSFLDGECQDGYWYENGEFICFLYDHAPDSPQCWTFFREGRGLRALFEGTEGETELYEAGDAQEQLTCLGPQIGV